MDRTLLKVEQVFQGLVLVQPQPEQFLFSMTSFIVTIRPVGLASLNEERSIAGEQLFTLVVYGPNFPRKVTAFVEEVP